MVSFAVPLAAPRMDFAIDFNNQSSCMTIKINNKTLNDLLSSKMKLC